MFVIYDTGHCSYISYYFQNNGFTAMPFVFVCHDVHAILLKITLIL